MKPIRQIRIREMRLPAARDRLEQELNDAFLAGEQRVHVLHGIGSGALKRMTAEVVSQYDFCRLVELDATLYNPGISVVDLFPPDPSAIRQYMA